MNIILGDIRYYYVDNDGGTSNIYSYFLHPYLNLHGHTPNRYSLSQNKSIILFLYAWIMLAW